MKPSKTEKLVFVIAIMIGTAAMIFISTHFFVGVLGVCK
jgi:hypothetical protein